MMRAAHLAGQAINISKTTGPHAVSYTMTSYFGVPHGHAVGLTLGEFLVYNSQVSEKDVNDPRGAAYVRDTIATINNLLGTSSATAARDKITALMRSVGLETRLSELKIHGAENLNLIADSTNYERVVNNPRKVTRKAVMEVLQRIE
jgi:alcohol dehydrogenase class IV